MALTPSNDEAFLREVDDELRREQMTLMWKRYGKIAAVAIGLFLIALAIFLWWRAEQVKVAEAQGEQFNAATIDLQAGRKTDAEKKFDALIESGKPGYRATSLLMKAAILTDRGDKKGTLALYAKIAADSSLAQPYRDLASLRQTLIEFDDVAPQVVIDRLKPLVVEDNAYFGTAGELTALAMIKTNRGTEAGRLLGTIARDKDVPSSIRGRAAQLAASLGVYVDPTATKKD